MLVSWVMVPGFTNSFDWELTRSLTLTKKYSLHNTTNQSEPACL